jgi:predicted transcriptional regulator
MQKNSQDFSMEDVAKVAATPEAQQLLTMLRKADPHQLQKVADQAASGDYAQASRILRQMLSSPEGQDIMKRFGEVADGRTGK